MDYSKIYVNRIRKLCKERGITVNHEQYQSLKKLIHTIVAPESE